MVKTILCIAVAIGGTFGCESNPGHLTLRPVAERWSQVPKEMAQPIVLKVSGADDVQTASVAYAPGRTMDIYYPGNFDFAKPAPVVVFVMGYSTEFTMNWFGAKLKDLGQYVSWGQLVAASGMVGVSYETDYPDDDIEAVLRHVIRNGSALGMDSKRVGLFACSGNTLTGLGALAVKGADYGDALRCGVIFYPIISYFMNKGDEVMAAPFKRELRKDLPIFMVTVGNDRPEWMEAAAAFLAGVRGKGYSLEVASYEKGVHGFDTDQDTDESRALIAHAVAFMREKLAE